MSTALPLPVSVPSPLAILEDKPLVEDVRKLSRVNNVRAALIIAQQWATIAAVVAAAVYFDRWWLYIPAAAIIAAKQQALGIIMHDATHYRLFTARWANEYISNFLCAFPLGMSTQGYRGEHLEHHLATNTPEDPYYRMFQSNTMWQWPKTRWQAFRQLLGDVSGWHSLSSMKVLRRWMPINQFLLHRNDPKLARRVKIDVLCSITFWAAMVTLFSYFGVWKYFLLLWVVPNATFYVLYMRIRWIAEHPYDQQADLSDSTRHVRGTWLERYTIAPLNINYHIAHHLFPAVPLYNLPRVHARLMENDVYREHGELFHDYLGKVDSIRAELIVR